MERGVLDYNPSRDIPKAVEQLKTLSPTVLAQWVRDNRTEKDALGKKSQKDITPESIIMWLKRHPDIKNTLERQLESELVTPDAIREDLFQNGFFEKVPCVEKWQLAMRAKGAKDSAINHFTRTLSQICRGEYPQTKKDRKKWKHEHPEQPVQPREYIEGWGLKHPARLTLDDCLKYNNELAKRGLSTHRFRLVMRNFLKSRMVEGWDTISGALDSMGKYAHLYAPPAKIRMIFAWLKQVNLEAHDISYFSYKTAGRLTACMTAEAKYVDRERHTTFLFEKASLHGQKRKQKKFISRDLWQIIEPRLETAKEHDGRLFNITPDELNGLLRACYRECIPELADEIPMPFHFWRHQFAQHGLRATGWNYGLIARLGHWTVETLERCYGKMDEQTAFTQARGFVYKLGNVTDYPQPEIEEMDVIPVLSSPA